MRTLISALALAFAFSAPAAFAKDDTVKSNPNPDKPGRAIEGVVKSEGGDTSRPGRKVEDDGAVKTKKATHARQGRAIDKTKKKKAAAVEEKQGRAAEGDVKSGKEGVEKQGRAAEKEVKTGKEGVEKQGRAAEKEVKTGKEGVEKQGRAVQN